MKLTKCKNGHYYDADKYEECPYCDGDMPFNIIRDDITKVSTDAIVNTANPRPIFGSGTDYAIYKAAGVEDLLAERKKIGNITPGEVAVTPAFRLSAKFIIHTVGPIWIDGKHGEFGLLESCYRKSLLLAKQLGCKSIAFPLVATGAYRFPKDKALKIALETISAFLEENEMSVTLVVFDKSSFKLSTDLVQDVIHFINDNYVEQRLSKEYDPELEERTVPFYGLKTEHIHNAYRESITETYGDNSDFNDIINRKLHDGYSLDASISHSRFPDFKNSLGENFQTRLLHLIDERGLTDVEVYKRANVDRKLFSKIRCNPSYSPKKQTALALAIALKLNSAETEDLLKRAGLALSPGSISDLIVKYCIDKHIYDIFEINALLFEYDQPLLGY